jgi:hypothetical protein
MLGGCWPELYCEGAAVWECVRPDGAAFHSWWLQLNNWAGRQLHHQCLWASEQNLQWTASKCMPHYTGQAVICYRWDLTTGQAYMLHSQRPTFSRMCINELPAALNTFSKLIMLVEGTNVIISSKHFHVYGLAYYIDSMYACQACT